MTNRGHINHAVTGVLRELWLSTMPTEHTIKETPFMNDSCSVFFGVASAPLAKITAYIRL